MIPYVAITAFRLLASVRIALWLSHRDAAPIVKLFALYFWSIAIQRVIWLARSGLSASFSIDVFLIVGVGLETATLVVLVWKFWKRTI